MGSSTKVFVETTEWMLGDRITLVSVLPQGSSFQAQVERHPRSLSEMEAYALAEYAVEPIDAETIGALFNGVPSGKYVVLQTKQVGGQVVVQGDTCEFDLFNIDRAQKTIYKRAINEAAKVIVQLEGLQWSMKYSAVLYGRNLCPIRPTENEILLFRRGPKRIDELSRPSYVSIVTTIRKCAEEACDILSTVEQSSPLDFYRLFTRACRNSLDKSSPVLYADSFS